MKTGLISSLVTSALILLYAFYQNSILKTFVFYEFLVGVIGFVLSGVIFSSYLGLDRKRMSNADSPKVFGENHINKEALRNENDKVKNMSIVFFFFSLICFFISLVTYLISTLFL
ncbi:hypothetical protein HP567_001630 [Brevibacillus sp. M2.1A]|uniref:DUF3899 domain-containing protein n=1 Tax=Brevibacillus antibioticus TaxID=2570228 RepID=A0A4U2YBQ2_9BACL|nr:MULTISPECIES: hypothetical protein [Brevibacillus]MCC8433325.1 hypothetical protein [Brevibacillus sp. M2.1A]TKI58257.1 hypothetical protein E8L90_24275 [Brevibacillus antibioticus]